MISREDYDFSQPAEYSYNGKAFSNSKPPYTFLDYRLAEYAVCFYSDTRRNPLSIRDERKDHERILKNLLPHVPDAEDYLLARKAEYEAQLTNPDAVEQRLSEEVIKADIKATQKCIELYHSLQKGKNK